MKLVLASQSPRRSEILKNAGLDFTVRVADADETIPNGTKPSDAVVFLAARKAMAGFFLIILIYLSFFT